MKEISSIGRHVINRLEKNLSPEYVYHSAAHTRYVVEKARFLAERENIDEAQTRLITLGAYYHDIGFLTGPENHEERGCKIMRTELPAHGFTHDEIDTVCGMIMATKVPQNPQTAAEKIVADADLFYLGTEDFFDTGELLFKELNLRGADLSRAEWNALQIKFLKAHRYHTDYGRQTLEPVKQAHLKELMNSAT